MKTIVALFDELDVAQSASSELMAAGIQPERIHLESATEEVVSEVEEKPSFLKRLFGFGVEKDHAELYAEGIRRGRSVLTVECGDDEIGLVENALERYDPVDVDTRQMSWREQGWRGYQETAPRYSASEIDEDRRFTRDREQAQRIPVTEETLHVSKERVSTGRARVRSYTREEPVAQDVELAQERVVVERRPAEGAAPAQAFQDRSIEVETFGEEPIIEKEARLVEEVVVGKELDTRVERVEDTVKKTVVDVDDESKRAPEGR